MKNKNLAKIVAIVFVIGMIFGSFNGFFNPIMNTLSDPSIKSSGPLDINLDETSLSIQYGSNLQEDRPYIFSGAFYDITSDIRTWTTPAVLETVYSQFNGDVWANDTITDMNNVEIQSPSNSSITMVQGSQYQNGTLNQLDNDYAVFNSTSDNVVEATNFTTNYGSEVSAGNLTSIDGDYSTYQSGYETSLPVLGDFTLNNGTLVQNGTIFPATYSFEGDTIGGDPTGWTVDETGGTVNVIGIEGDHKKVIDLYDSGASYVSTTQTFSSSQESGTIEFYARISINTNDVNFYLKKTGDGDQKITVSFASSGYIIGQATTLQPYSANVWYHIRIDFECGAGGYMGLSADTCFIYVNGVIYGAYSFITVSDVIDYLFIRTETGSSYHAYVDAVGYSWDGGYDIGDNMISNFADLSTIDNDYMVYQSTETGHYPATYSFTDDVIGSNPTGWNVTEDPSTNVFVQGTFNNHKKVLHFDDNNAGAGNDVQISQFIDNEEYGTVEFWFYLTRNDYESGLALYDGASYIAYVYFGRATKFGYYVTGYNDLVVVSANAWHHFRIDFECGAGGYQGLSADTFCMYLDNVKYGAYASNSLNSLTSVNLRTGYSSTDDFYVDAIGYSWDVNYVLGDNWYWQNYLGTYDFENDATFSDPNGWTVGETATSTVNVYGFDSVHRKTVEFDDNSGTDVCSITDTISQTSGTIEWYWRMNTVAVSKQVYFNLKSAGIVGISMSMYEGQITYYDGSHHNIQAFSANIWYLMRVDFNTDTDKYDIYVNNVLKFSDLSFWNVIGTADTVLFSTVGVYTGYKAYLDSISYSWLNDIGDNQLLNYYPILNFTTTFQLNMENRNLAIFHSLKTDTSQTINISIYNFDTSSFDLMNSSISLAFTLDHFLFNSSYYNATNYVIIKVVGLNLTTDFHCFLEVLYARNSPILDVESTINCNLLDNFIYSYRTNITQAVELYLFNFSSSSYDLLYNYSYLTFNLNYTTISSDYHNGSAMIVRFRAINFDYNNFTFYLEVLKVINITRLDVTMHVNLDYVTYLLQLNCSAWYYTPLYTVMNFSIYDFDNSVWILINSSGNDVGFYESQYHNNSVNLSNFIDTTNDNQVLVRFNAINQTNEFLLFLDCLNVTMYRKLVLSFEKTFTLLGTWKYRFHIPDDSYVSPWYYFDVVQHLDNFMAISESPYITKWVLINNETKISTSLRFKDDMDGTYDWWLTTDTDLELERQGFAQVTYVDQYYPTTNRGNAWDAYTGYLSGYYTREFFLWDYTTDNTYFYENHTSNSIFTSRTYWGLGSPNMKIYAYRVGSFSETGITWNNQPSTIGAYLSSNERTWADSTWYNFDLGSTPYTYYCLRYEVASNNQIAMYTDDYANYHPYITHYYSKSNYNTTGGYWYMQTDETETLNMTSGQHNDISLLANDFFTIDCQSSVENLQLQLLNDGVIVDTLDVLKNNVDSDRQIIEISVDKNVVFDQLRFTGLFDDTEYFKCYSIRADGYDTTTRQKTTTTYIAPEESQTLLLSTGEHLLKIYDSNILRTYKWINITHDIQDNLEIYQPIYITNCRLALIDQNNNLLDFNLFQVYATRTLLDITSRIPILDEFFDADKGTTIKFEFYDRFGDFIKNETKEVQTYLYIIINTYSLKIKNEASNYSNIIISKTGSLINIIDILAPQELYIYRLITGNYSVEYLNNENNETIYYNITLSSDYVLTLPTSYYSVYFSVFNYDGLGLDGNLFRFYINGERKDFGFNTMTKIVNNLKVLDFFNATLKNINVNLGNYNEYNLIVQVYTMFILNNYNRTINIEIKRDGTSITIEQIIPSRSGLEYRFLPNIDYTIIAMEQNGTILDSKTINLNSNNKIVDFGFYSTELPIIPEPFVQSNFMLMFIIFSFFISVSYVIFIIIYFKPKKIPEFNDTSKYKKNHKTNATSFDFRLIE